MKLPMRLLLFQKAGCSGLFAPEAAEKVERLPVFLLLLELVFDAQLTLPYWTKRLACTINCGQRPAGLWFYRETQSTFALIVRKAGSWALIAVT